MSRTQTLLPVALAWETRATCRTQLVGDLAPALTASSECPSLCRNQPLGRRACNDGTWSGLSMGRLAHQQPRFMQRGGDMAPAQSRAASNPFVGYACMNGSRRRGEEGENIEMTTEHARSNLCGAHGCMRLWVAVQKMPHAARDAHAHEQTDSCAFGWTNADEVGAREEGTCLSAHCDT